MLRSALALPISVILAVLLAVGCGKPKQAEAPDVLEDKGADMSGGEEKPEAAAGEAQTKESAEAMRTKCCGECKTGLEKDRTGQPADKIPCSDFTDSLSPWCLEHFRSKPAMAAECK